MRRRQMLAASAALALPGCDGEGPVTSEQGGDWHTPENQRRASELLSDPQRALALMPPAVVEAAQRLSQPWTEAEIGLAQQPIRGTNAFDISENHAFRAVRGLIYETRESRRIEFAADGNTFLRSYPVLTDFRILFGFPALPLLRVETGFAQVAALGRRPSPGTVDQRVRYATTAIHRMEGGIRPDQVGSRMTLERHVQDLSPGTLQPIGAGARVTETWTVAERLDEVSLWRGIVTRRVSAANRHFSNGTAAELRGDHVRITYRIDGVRAPITNFTEGVESSLLVPLIMGTSEDRNLERLVLTPAGQQRLQATRDAAERRIEDIAARARGVPAANRARATGLFQAAFGLWQSGNFNGAISGFNEGLDLDVGNGRAHYYLADSYAKLPLEDWQHDGRRAAQLLRRHHLRLATLLAPADSREGIMARTELQQS